MGDYEFYVTKRDLDRIADEFDLEDPQPLEYDGGFVGLLHTAEVRPLMLTCAMVQTLYKQLYDVDAVKPARDVLDELVQVLADLQAHSSFHVDHQRNVTYWNNVGLRAEE